MLKRFDWICLSLLLGVALQLNAQISILQPEQLKSEFKENPLGIDIQNPLLSWTFKPNGRNQFQTAYEIIVSTDQEELKGGKGNVWATGKNISTNNINIEFKGSDLQPFTRYYWKVKVYDQNDVASDWSATSWFETAMLRESDWKAYWIGDGSEQFKRDEDFYQDDRMPLFRKAFESKGRIVSARLYISGLGYYEAYVNGSKVGKSVLDPGWTTYSEQVLYAVHDITDLIKSGSNVAAVTLGNGWFNPLPLKLFGSFNLREVQETGRPCVKAQMLIKYADGSTETIITDETWKTAPGPIVRNNVYLGEYYDGRLEQPNWNIKGRLSNDWKNAIKVAGPSGKLTAQMQPPIKITQVVKPVKIFALGNGIFIADMGQNFAGVARIKVRAKKGTRINLRYGEALHPDGKLNFLTTVAGHIKEMWNLKGGNGAPPTAWQEDIYVAKGTGLETWAPTFTFHGFRYVEITGWPGTPTINDIEGLRMNADLKPVGEFSCSNEMFNALHDVIQWTFLSNVFSVQSDCPGREKMGYGADIVATANAYMYNYDMHNFYRKTIQDFANDQQPDGGITEIAPYTGIHVKGLGGHSGPLGWQLAFPYVQKQLYEFYGDKRVIEKHYPAFKKQLEFLQSKAIDGLFHWDISDHEAIDPKPEALSASAFYYHHALLGATFAGILDKPEDSIYYAKLTEKIKHDIVQKYYVPRTGRFDNGTQSAQLFGLWYGLTPDKDASLEVLMNEFERHNYHVSSGIFGLMMMFDVLRENNMSDMAYKLVNQRDYPGWGFMLEKGATTLWETWKYPDNAGSQNHPMFGSVDEWFYRSLLGINPLKPGFEKILIKPQPAGDLTSATGSYNSVRGRISSAWEIKDKQFTLMVKIPANTNAEIWVPSSKATHGGNENKTTKNDSPKFIKYEDGYSVFQTGSGEYSFTAMYEK